MRAINNIEITNISGGDEQSYNVGTSIGEFLGDAWNAIGEAWDSFDDYMTRVGEEMRLDEPAEVPQNSEGFGTI